MKKIAKINFCIALTLVFILKGINVFAQPNNKIARFAVLFHNENDPYISEIKKALQEIQQNNQGKVEFIFYNGESNQEIQNSQLEDAVNNNVDELMVNIVDFNSAAPLVDKAKETNKPIVFFNREPNNLSSLQSYGKAIYIGTSGCESGVMKADMILHQIRNNSILDRNSNNQLDYIFLKGERNNVEAKERTECVINELKRNGIKTNELYSEYMNWNKEITKERLMPVLLRLIATTDIIISNNDEMAIGAIESLQSYGYNLYDDRRCIPVFGIDGIPEAISLIEKGEMAGTVIQDAKSMVEAVYITAFNLSEGIEPLEGTNYSFDETGAAIRIPYPGYIVKNLN